MIYLISDTHFGHAAMLTYCNRPRGFDLLEIKNLQRTLKPEDVLIHLGDICIRQDEMWHRQLSTIPGKKWLIKGNHDGKSNSWYLSHGWDFVGDILFDTYYGKRILFSHQPIMVDSLIQFYDFNIHGHMHNTQHRSVGKTRELQSEYNERYKWLLFAVEYTNYRPVPLKVFIEDYEKFKGNS